MAEPGNIAAQLVAAGIDERRVLDACTKITGLPAAPAHWIHTPRPPDDPELDLDLCQRISAVPLATDRGRLCIAFANPELAKRGASMGLPEHTAFLALPHEVERAWTTINRSKARAGPKASQATHRTTDDDLELLSDADAEALEGTQEHGKDKAMEDEEDEFGERTVAHDAFSTSGGGASIKPAPKPAPPPEMDDGPSGDDPFASTPTLANMAFMRPPGRVDLSVPVARTPVLKNPEVLFFTASGTGEPLPGDAPAAPPKAAPPPPSTPTPAPAAKAKAKSAAPVMSPPPPPEERNERTELLDNVPGLPGMGLDKAAAKPAELPSASAGSASSSPTPPAAAAGGGKAKASLSVDNALLDALAAAADDVAGKKGGAKAAPAAAPAPAAKAEVKAPEAGASSTPARGPVPSLDPYLAPTAVMKPGSLGGAPSAPAGGAGAKGAARPEKSGKSPAARGGPPGRRPSAANKRSPMTWAAIAVVAVLGLVAVVRIGGRSGGAQTPGVIDRSKLTETEARQLELIERANQRAKVHEAAALYSEAISLNPTSRVASDAFLGRARSFLALGELQGAEQDLMVLRRSGDYRDIQAKVEDLMSQVEEARQAKESSSGQPGRP